MRIQVIYESEELTAEQWKELANGGFVTLRNTEGCLGHGHQILVAGDRKTARHDITIAPSVARIAGEDYLEGHLIRLVVADD
jgi:hypothetical protein